MRELLELKKSPPEGIRVQTSEDDMLDVVGLIEGPGEFIHGLGRCGGTLLVAQKLNFISQRVPRTLADTLK